MQLHQEGIPLEFLGWFSFCPLKVLKKWNPFEDPLEGLPKKDWPKNWELQFLFKYEFCLKTVLSELRKIIFVCCETDKLYIYHVLNCDYVAIRQ